VRVDRLASFGPNVVGDLGPVLAVEAHRLQEPLVLVVGPVAVSLAPFVFDHISIC